jgi:hypothetical protein
MKNAAKYTEIIKNLQKSFLKEGKAPPAPKIDPLSALVKGALSYDIPDPRVEEALKVIGKEFVNLNELRVATQLEVRDMLGNKFPNIEQRVDLITLSLNMIFEREHTLSLDRLKTISRKDARQFLRELPGMLPYVEAYIMLVGLEGHALPIDSESIVFFRSLGIFDEKTTLDDAQKFIESHLKAEECWDFHYQLRKTALEKKKK